MIGAMGGSLSTTQRPRTNVEDASPKVLESMEDAPNIHEEEVLTG